jgi:hypothetical protein
MYAYEGMRLVAANIVTAVNDGGNADAREKVAMGSLLGGFCLGPVNTAGVHALSYPLGSMFHLAHGLSNALLLPYVMEYNIPAATNRYADVAIALGCSRMSSDEETAYAGVQFMAKGTAPTGQIGFVLNMEDTTPPDMLDPAGGGTCIATGVEGECTGPSSTFALTAEWTLVQLAWGALTPGVAATGVSVPATGDEITGMTLHVRGSDRSVDAVKEMIDAVGARGLDSWTGESFEPSIA